MYKLFSTIEKLLYNHSMRRTLDQNLSKDLIIQRLKNGIRLLAPEKLKHLPPEKVYRQSIEKIFNSEICCYFLNRDSQDLLLNNIALEACGFDSMQKALGKTLYDICPKNSAAPIIFSHRTAIKTQRIQVIEEDILRKDDKPFQHISFLFPWFDDDNKPLGLLGCSTKIANPSFANHLTQIMNIGFPQNASLQNSIVFSQNKIYLSKQEKAIAQLIARRYTAKMIAKNLGLSHRTVEHYTDNIKEKFLASSKFELMEKLQFYYGIFI